MNLEETKFENRAYFFSIDTVSFVKSMKKAGFGNEMLNMLINNAAKFNSLISDSYEVSGDVQKKMLDDSIELIKSCHYLLQNIRANDDKLLLKEKANLQIEASSLTQELIKFVSVNCN